MKHVLMLCALAAAVSYSAGARLNAATRSNPVKTSYVYMGGADGVVYVANINVPPCGSVDKDSKEKLNLYTTETKDEIVVECRTK